MIKVVEDILIFDHDYDTHVKRVKQVLQRCQEYGITLNKKKVIFAEPKVEWCGFVISEEGYTTSESLVQALKEFPRPKNKTDVRSFCGLVQQFECFSSKITELAQPLRCLLSLKVEFNWETYHEEAFQKLIRELTNTKVLAQFDPNQPLRLETDAAQSQGLGYGLWQQ